MRTGRAAISRSTPACADHTAQSQSPAACFSVGQGLSQLPNQPACEQAKACPGEEIRGGHKEPGGSCLRVQALVTVQTPLAVELFVGLMRCQGGLTSPCTSTFTRDVVATSAAGCC